MAAPVDASVDVTDARQTAGLIALPREMMSRAAGGSFN